MDIGPFLQQDLVMGGETTRSAGFDFERKSIDFQGIEWTSMVYPVRVVRKEEVEKIEETEFTPKIHPLQWHLKKTVINKQTIDAHINIEEAWKTSRGAGSTIAMIGDGVDVTHPEIKKNIVNQYDSTRDKEDASPQKAEENNGTALAGIICGLGIDSIGVAPEARLMPVRMDSGLGSIAEAKAIVWCADKGADVILFGYGVGDGEWWDPIDSKHKKKTKLTDSTKAALNYAASKGRKGKGCILCYSAGNGNESIENDGYAMHADMIVVSACNDQNRRSVYSDYGQNVLCCAPSNDFGWDPFKHSAPLTEGIRTIDRVGKNGYGPDNYINNSGGTTAATAMVAGIIGLILSIKPDLELNDIKYIIKHSCTKIDINNGDYDADGHSKWYGYGKIDAGLAILNTLNFEALKTQKQPQRILNFYPDKKIIQQMIVGNKINMTAIAWHELLIKVSKPVGRVVLESGEMGTGFLLNDGYLLTANHVLPKEDAIKLAHLEMNYEMDANGQIKNKTIYKLDASDFVFSPINELNFTYVKVIDRPEEPLSQWGYIEIESESNLKPEDSLVVISHPKGEDKKVSFDPKGLTEINQIKNEIVYRNDTEPGSSGAPVLNSLLHVVALHLGKKQSENLNYGKSIVAICEFIERKHGIKISS